MGLRVLPGRQVAGLREWRQDRARLEPHELGLLHLRAAGPHAESGEVCVAQRGPAGHEHGCRRGHKDMERQETGVCRYYLDA